MLGTLGTGLQTPSRWAGQRFSGFQLQLGNPALPPADELHRLFKPILQG